VRPLLGGIDAWADAGYALEEFIEPGIMARPAESNPSVTGGNT
jgi:hypothetical protein